MSKIKDTLLEDIFPVPENMRVREEAIGIHCVNPFVPCDSSARSYMFSGHLSQPIVIENGDEKIVQSGLEKQLGDNTFSKKIPEDSKVLKVIKRYNSITADSVTATTQMLVIIENIKTGQIDYVDLPYYFSLHQYFGFKYKWNTELLNNITTGTVLKKDTVLADSPTVTENKGYKFGVNANLCLLGIPETAEDGVVISESMAERLSYTIFETRVIEFGEDTFPLNLYGDKNNYKPIPDIGDFVPDNSVIMAVRRYNGKYLPAMTSVNDLMEFSTTHDIAYYMKGPGIKETASGDKVGVGKVVDIKVYQSPKFKQETYPIAVEKLSKYVNGGIKFYKDILDTYTGIKNEHYQRFRDNSLLLSERMQRLLIDAQAIVNPNNNKITYSFKNEPLDLFRVEITVAYKIIPGRGNKLTDTHGIANQSSFTLLGDHK